MSREHRHGKHGRRTKTGCLTCRKRHYKCDESYPRCNRCVNSKAECTWAKIPDHIDELGLSFSDNYEGQGLDRGTVEVTAEQIPSIALNTRETDQLTYYISQFHQYSYQISAWTGLIALPRKSPIPSILQTNRRDAKKMTNWATFYLPHLTVGTPNDPLSLIMAAFTALRMREPRTAAVYYARVLSLLRSILEKKDAASMKNQDFLRIWATTLLMAEYEAALGNQKFQSHHVDGATTLSFIAASRFALSSASSSEHHAETQSTISATHSQQSSRLSISEQSRSDDQRASEHEEYRPAQQAAEKATPRNERELPAYLMALTQRLRHSSVICESLDTVWPTFVQPPIEAQSLGGLLEKSAECYAHVMPLVEDFYTKMATSPPTSPGDFMLLMSQFQPRVVAARLCIAEYQHMLSQMNDSNGEIYQSCAKPGFPFSPVIKFVNPLMAQPTVIPQVFLLFLAPFMTLEEHESVIRFISGVYAGFLESPGMMMDAAFPDLYVATFWKRGEERDFFSFEVYTRSEDFMYVINRIWGTIDYLELSENQPVSNTEKLGIALKEYRHAQAKGMKLQHTRH